MSRPSNRSIYTTEATMARTKRSIERSRYLSSIQDSSKGSGWDWQPTLSTSNTCKPTAKQGEEVPDELPNIFPLRFPFISAHQYPVDTPKQNKHKHVRSTAGRLTSMSLYVSQSSAYFILQENMSSSALHSIYTQYVHLCSHVVYLLHTNTKLTSPSKLPETTKMTLWLQKLQPKHLWHFSECIEKEPIWLFLRRRIFCILS